MDEINQWVKIKWRVNDIIRNKENGHPYLVLAVNKIYSLLVDLEEKDTFKTPLTLLSRDFYKYARDHEMEKKSRGWQYNFIAI